ncbi:MAG TPA: hypothetical protein VMH50_09800 [Thermoleophilia bacterium]|nr:hypothetical protein [Thermoleophilia bacterium]
MAEEVWELEWDEVNEEHVSEHGFSIREINQVLANFNITVRNRQKRRAEFLLIGRTHGGQIVAVPVRKTRTKGTWRPVTAHPPTKAQQRVFERAERSRP